MKIKILGISHKPNDAHSFWRYYGPFSYLSKSSRHEIQVDTKIPSRDDIYWNDVCNYDLVYFHRACTKDDLTVIQLAKMFGVPVWVDLDDWLFDVPVWNPNSGFYNLVGTKNYIAHALACADVVTVTTTELYNQVRKINENVIICPNAYRDDLFTYRKNQLKATSPIVAWRGTNTHDGDLFSVLPAFKELHGITHFLGSCSWQVLQQMPPNSFQTLTNQDFAMYFLYVYKLKPKVMIVPLANHFFNQCKSNIAWIEALHAGALCVAPNMPEWHRPGCVNYEPNNPDSFRDAVNSVLDMDVDSHFEQVASAFDHMKDLYGIQTVNQIRIGILEAVLSSEFKKNTRDPFDQLTALWALTQLTNVPTLVRD